MQEIPADRQAKNPQNEKNVLRHAHITYIINHWKENLPSFLTAKECVAWVQQTDDAVHGAVLDRNKFWSVGHSLFLR